MSNLFLMSKRCGKCKRIFPMSHYISTRKNKPITKYCIRCRRISAISHALRRAEIKAGTYTGSKRGYPRNRSTNNSCEAKVRKEQNLDDHFAGTQEEDCFKQFTICGDLVVNAQQ